MFSLNNDPPIQKLNEICTLGHLEKNVKKWHMVSSFEESWLAPYPPWTNLLENLRFYIGWAGSLHDANLWGRTMIGQFYEGGKLSLYALVGDAAYPCRPWMLAPYKGHKDGLTYEEYHWNFLQSSSRMCNGHLEC